MKTCIIMQGAPGSGKSTWARTLTEFMGTVVSADDYMVDADGNYAFDPAKLQDCHTKCKFAFLEAIARGCCEETDLIVVDNTNTRQWEAEWYMQRANVFGYNIVVMTCHGQYTNKHNAPPATINSIRERMEFLRVPV